MFRLDPYDREGYTFDNARFAHMTTARRLATELSREYDERVVIVREGEPERAVLIVCPDGRCLPPPAARTACTATAEPDKPCWCPAHRAIRAAER